MKNRTAFPASAAPRPGVTLVIVVFCAVIFMAMLAHVVDVGYMCVVKTQMQAAADSASMAAVAKLMHRDLLQGGSTYPTNGVIQARDQGVALAALHRAGNVTTLTLDRNDGNTSSGDVVIGTLPNPSDPNSTFTPANSGAVNAVQVLVHRDSTRNGNINLSFARIWNLTSQPMTATATAVLINDIRGFRIPPGSPNLPKLLPLAMDLDTWTNEIINARGLDNWSYDSETNGVSSGNDNIHEARLFPTAGQSPGNFGTIDIGSPSNGTNELVRQILYGPNADDLAYYTGGEFKLGQDGTLATEGDTGISAGIESSLQAIIGQPRAIALYRSPVIQSGNTAQFTIVAFAGIIITEAVLTGNNKHVTIQPEFLIDPTGIGGTGNTSYYLYKGTFLAR